ncbi:MAG TPA: transglycosylase SLT domain-containing protein [Rhodocyclaceae bacterium]|nr:transglycosylase SLT domain-containing protein [Rhodocyclaceae bacterium]
MAPRPLPKRLSGFLGALLAVCSLAAAGAADPFLEAHEAFQKNQPAKLEAAAAKLKKHPLAPYVDYYRWRLDLEQGDASRTAGLIARFDGDYLGELVRVDWTKHLARSGQWERFNEALTGVAAPDAELRCLALEARRLRPDPALLADARQFWQTQIDLPEACEVFFRNVILLSQLDERDVWDRARRHFEAGRYAHGRKTLSYLPKGQQVEDRVWAALNNKTERFLDGIIANPTVGPRNAELAALALLRLARQDPAVAAKYLSRLGPRLPAADRTGLWGAVATQAAILHQAEAPEWFGRARGGKLYDEQYRWAVRAALRAGDWAGVRAAIEAMPATLSAEPAWVYWLGRSYQAAGKPKVAALLWSEIAGQSDFYGLLAAEELDRRFRQPPKAVAPTAAELAQVEDSVAIQRALALFRLDLRTEGLREWAWATRGMSDRQLLAAAEYAKRQRVYDRAINAAERTVSEHDYSLRYLTPFDDKIRPAAKAQALDDAWVYGLMRQESRFASVAKSAVGAQGLMQLMPATARYVARKLGLRDYHPSRVAEIDLNVVLGTSYLRMVYESLDKHPVLASAAYNAGPSRARKWRDPQRRLEGAIYTETIPFSETRDYVKKVMANAVIYTTLLSGQPDSLKARLGVVKPIAESVPPDEDLP